MGYAYGVNAKVASLLNASKAKQQEWGLVPVDPRKNAENWYTKGSALKVSRGRSAQYNAAGMAAGQNVNLNRGVSHKGGSTVLLGS
jgi:hypothetical protein